MNVLSLFDGMSCGQIALKELGADVNKYYACEIDKFAISQTQLNFPDTIQMGNVLDLDVSSLERIDLLIGGSPCQSFSFAGKCNGMTTTCDIEILTLEHYLQLKADGFKFEGQSYLFWEYMRILTEIRQYNPNVLFLLENVEMGTKWESILSQAIGVFGVHINSDLVSAQSRKRIYWTNIRTRSEGFFGALHSDIPQPQDRGLFLRDILESEVSEKYCICKSKVDWLYKHAIKRKKQFKILDGSSKAYCVTVAGCSGFNLATNCIKVSEDGSVIRKLTPTECARLQTVPDWYVWKCSENQKYKMLGNGWTIEVIKHILQYVEE